MRNEKFIHTGRTSPENVPGRSADTFQSLSAAAAAAAASEKR